jgi:hypothetical protein
VIHALERLRPPASRLLEETARRRVAPESKTLAIGLADRPGAVDVPALAARIGAERNLVLGLLGTHRDARASELRELWDLEEAARATGLPTLALRFGPLVGPGSPLWQRLASRPRLRRPALLVCPVAEEDALLTLARALTDPARRAGWYEVAGEPMRLDELVGLASGPGERRHPKGAWEPPLRVLEEQRLADPEPWTRDFGLSLARLGDRVGGWAA